MEARWAEETYLKTLKILMFKNFLTGSVRLANQLFIKAKDWSENILMFLKSYLNLQQHCDLNM